MTNVIKTLALERLRAGAAYLPVMLAFAVVAAIAGGLVRSAAPQSGSGQFDTENPIRNAPTMGLATPQDASVSTRPADFILSAIPIGLSPTLVAKSPVASPDLIEAGILACANPPGENESATEARVLQCDLSMPGRPESERYVGFIRSSGSKPGFAQHTLTQWRILAPRQQDVSRGALEGTYSGKISALLQDWGVHSYLMGGAENTILLLPLGMHVGQDLQVGDVVAELRLAWIKV